MMSLASGHDERLGSGLRRSFSRIHMLLDFTNGNHFFIGFLFQFSFAYPERDKKAVKVPNLQRCEFQEKDLVQLRDVFC
jgi:hypothetical protein